MNNDEINVLLKKEPVTEEVKQSLANIPICLPQSVAISIDDMQEIHIALVLQTSLGNEIKFAMDAGTFLEWSSRIQEELKKILRLH